MTLRDMYVTEQYAKADAFTAAAGMVPVNATHCGLNLRETLTSYAAVCRRNAEDSARMDATQWRRDVGAYL